MRISWKQINQHYDISMLPESVQQSRNSSQALWHFENKQFQIPMCRHCGNNHTKWDATTKAYRTFCSVQCGALSEETTAKKNSTAERTGTRKQGSQARKATLIDRYGSNFGKKILERSRNTMEKRYGVKHAHQNPESRKKFTDSMMKKYDVPYAMQNSELSHKHADACMRNWGVKSALSSECVRQRRKKTMIDRYGSEHALQNTEVLKKLQDTMREKYGVPWINQQHIPENSLSILSDVNKLSEHLEQYKTYARASYQLGVDPTTVANYADVHGLSSAFSNASLFEDCVEEILHSLQVAYVKNDRTAIAPRELDFWIPSHNVAIECNGAYWHSDKFKDKNYHVDKWQACANQGIRLIQIADVDFFNHPAKFTALLMSAMGQRRRGDPARKCRVVQTKSQAIKKFLDEHHLQSSVSGTHFVAYDCDDNIAGVMTFGWTQGSRESRRFELKRWVTDGRTHAGLFSRVFRYAQRELDFEKVVSFSQNDWFTGDVYSQCGFDQEDVVGPAYRYLCGNRLYHRSKFTKSNIVKQFPELKQMKEQGYTETQMTQALGIHRVWDSGKIAWTWNKL